MKIVMDKKNYDRLHKKGTFPIIYDGVQVLLKISFLKEGKDKKEYVNIVDSSNPKMFAIGECVDVYVSA